MLKELDTAVNAGKVVLPFMLEECQLSDEFNFLLTGAQRYSAYQKKAEVLESLISRIHAITQSDASQVQSEVSLQPEPAVMPETEEKPEIPAKSGQKKPNLQETYFGIAQCPACGSTDLIAQKRKTGRFTWPERLTLLAIPVCAVLFSFLIGVIWIMLTMGTSLEDRYFSMILLIGLVTGGTLGFLGLNEWIRRRRIRRHLCPYPFRCRKCKLEFLAEGDSD